MGCGGGGGGGSVSVSRPLEANPVVLTVQADGLTKTAAYTISTNLLQGASSGYFVTNNFMVQWAGAGLTYSSGYAMPTGGYLTSFSVSTPSASQLWYSIAGLSYDLSRSVPSLYFDTVFADAISSASVITIIGTSQNDTAGWLGNTTSVDLGAGNDTMLFSQNFSSYSFSRVVGSSTQVNVNRLGVGTVLVKNVEYFQFADRTKTISEILATIP